MSLKIRYGDPEWSIREWTAGSYSEGDEVFVAFTGGVSYWRAKRDIANSNASPSAGANWEVAKSLEANAARYFGMAGRFFKWYLGTQGTHFHDSIIATRSRGFSSYRRSNGSTLILNETPVGRANRILQGLGPFIFAKGWNAPGCPDFSDNDIQTLRDRMQILLVQNGLGNRWLGGPPFTGISNSSPPYPDGDYETWSSSADYGRSVQHITLHDGKVWLSRLASQSQLRFNEPRTGSTYWTQIGTVWAPDINYSEGDLCHRHSRIWRAKKDNVNREPTIEYTEEWVETPFHSFGPWHLFTSQGSGFPLAIILNPDDFEDWQKRKIRWNTIVEGGTRGIGAFLQEAGSGHQNVTITPVSGQGTRSARAVAQADPRRSVIYDPGKGYSERNLPFVNIGGGGFKDGGGRIHQLGVEDGEVYFPGLGTANKTRNSNAEELAWHIWPTELCCAMMPRHEDRDKWIRGIIQKQIAQKGRDEDFTDIGNSGAISNFMVDGKRLYEHMIPPNSSLPRLGACVYHYFFANHQIRNHANYNIGSHRSRLLGALFLLLGGNELPDAYGFNIHQFLYKLTRDTQVWSPESIEVTGSNVTGAVRLRNRHSARNANGDRKSEIDAIVPNRMAQIDGGFGEINWNYSSHGNNNVQSSHELGRRERYNVFAAYFTLIRLLGGPLHEYSNELTIADSSASPAAATGVMAEPDEDAVLSLAANMGDGQSGDTITFPWNDIRGLNNYNGRANISTLTEGRGNDYLTGELNGMTAYILRRSPSIGNWSVFTTYAVGNKVFHGSGNNRRCYVSCRNFNRGVTPRNNSSHWTLATEPAEVWALVVGADGGKTRILFETDNLDSMETAFVRSEERNQIKTGVMAGTFKVSLDDNTIPTLEASASAHSQQCNLIQNLGFGMLGHHMNRRRTLPRVKRYELI